MLANRDDYVDNHMFDPGEALAATAPGPCMLLMAGIELTNLGTLALIKRSYYSEAVQVRFPFVKEK